MGEGAHWPVVFVDNFNRSTLGAGWSPYTGRPGSDPRTWWDPSMVWLSHGALVLAGAPSKSHANLWRTGAVSRWRTPQTYGRWEIRFRAPASRVLSYHFLLWPQSENWPPEIDIAEGYSRARTNSSAFIHWRDDDGRRQQRGFRVEGDFTQWTTVAVEWTPDAVRFFRNGVEYGAVTGQAVPHEPMFLALQTETRLARELPSGATPTQFVWVDWVRVRAYPG
ncbi:glycoside hydrolase family 16 protein [Microbacterium sp.]|uniref:glycoside hydrolase family 16 protein n=1 Tax=Microbacterium sp. TaxID=51671 RepID=UPI003A88F3A5